MEERNVVMDIDSMSAADVDRELAALKGAKDEGTPQVTEPTIQEPVASVEPEKKEVQQDPSGFTFDENGYLSQGWTKEQVDVLRKKEEQIWNKQKFIERQENEVASARKKELELQEKEQEIAKKIADISSQKEQLKDQFYDDPDAYNEAVAREFEFKRQQQDLQTQRQALSTQKMVFERVPEFQSLIESGEISAVLREDAQRAGYTEFQTQQLIDGFRSGWATADPRDVLVIAEKAKLRSELATYKSKLAEISQSPDVVGKKISQVANQRPAVNSSGDPALSLKDVNSMTADEIENELREMKLQIRR